ncbi:MAG: hypothetical protein NZL92_08275, partial [Gloeomargarita sp. SKYG116]|nr:hypothetical protein [Gloeomargarita sp. SKYG116]MDW8401678.1 hypothetical protein [Gloeomargarita sp. SKYGB_i_bin116]
MSGTKPQLNVIWGLAVMLLIGMMGGVAATLWAVRTFNWQGAPAVNEQANRSRPTLEEGKPATGLPGVEPKAKAIMSATSKDGRFRFDLQGCRYQDMKIICTLEVTNLTGLDMPFSLNTDGASRAYTDKGLEFNANIAQLG